MIELGLRLNPNKTKISDRVIVSSIKGDKLAWLISVKDGKNLQEKLLIIHNHSVNFPNSGSVIIELSKINSVLATLRVMSKYTDVNVLLAIVVDIAYYNPRSYPICFSIISNLLAFTSNDDEKQKIVNKIKEKFGNIPNTGYMEIWLQRISLPYRIDFSESICKLVNGENISLWNTKWISSKILKTSMATKNIVDYKYLEKISPRISQNEIYLFIHEDYR
jgi:hypothetical protein